MAKIAFLLLAHKAPKDVIRQAEVLTSVGDYVAIHYDASAPAAEYQEIRAALSNNPNVTFTKRRIRCGWGEWSLVDASLQTASAALEAFAKASHFYLVSGDCAPVKSAEYLHRTLDEQDKDFIESVDYFESNWIKTGMRSERLIYRHFVNERRHKKLFYTLLKVQKTLGLSRKIPQGLDMMIGSQWWCLRRRTLEAICDFIEGRPDIVRFFKTTWIPDETFFQTIVRHLVPSNEIDSRSPTFLMFSDYGLPVTFYNDHYELLAAQNYFFARKISQDANDLKIKLTTLFQSGPSAQETSDEGRALYTYVTGKGRVGRRVAPRFWETAADLGPERELSIIVCKKWHVGKRLANAITQATGIPNALYLFNEKTSHLPPLGGIESTLAKRRRHKASLLSLLFDHYDSNRLVICLDPNDSATLKDLAKQSSGLRILEVACHYDDAYLAGHAQRLGLISQTTPHQRMAELKHDIRDDIALEFKQIRQIAPDALSRVDETSEKMVNARALCEFLAIPAQAGQKLATLPNLFSD